MKKLFGRIKAGEAYEKIFFENKRIYRQIQG